MIPQRAALSPVGVFQPPHFADMTQLLFDHLYWSPAPIFAHLNGHRDRSDISNNDNTISEEDMGWISQAHVHTRNRFGVPLYPFPPSSQSRNYIRNNRQDFSLRNIFAGQTCTAPTSKQQHYKLDLKIIFLRWHFYKDPPSTPSNTPFFSARNRGPEALPKLITIKQYIGKRSPQHSWN